MSSTDTRHNTFSPRPTRRIAIDHDAMRRARGTRSFRDIAAEIGRHHYSVTSARIGQIERGDEPSPELFPLLARALGLSEDELRA